MNIESCSLHTQVSDERGPYTDVLQVPQCNGGSQYGVWEDAAGGFVHNLFDCALSAANWASDVLADEDPEAEFEIKAVCSEHWGQTADDCDYCFEESEETA